MTKLYINNTAHAADFIRLNEYWIKQYFQIEESDRKLAANPCTVIDNGGYILTLVEDEQVVGTCALFKQGNGIYELARLAVDKHYRSKGHGDRLVSEALSLLNNIGAHKVTLMSNTRLTTALALYKKHGFRILSEGPHPVYTRTNITMDKDLQVNKHV